MSELLRLRGRNMKRKIFWGALLTASAALLSAMLNVESKETPVPAKKPVIRIGATLPLSGENAYIGNSVRNAMEMAFGEWEKRGTRYEYQLVFDDDAMDPKKINRNTNRLVNVEKVNAVLTVLTPAATEANTITNDKKVIHFGCAYGDKMAEDYYSFNNLTRNDSMAQMMADALKEKGIRSIAILTSTDENSQVQSRILEEILNKDGSIEIVGKKVYQAGTESFANIIKSILKKGTPDIFFISGMTPDAANAARDLKEITGDVRLTTINDFAEAKDRSAFDGLWFVSSANATKEFSVRYGEQYMQPLYLCAPNSYDSLNMLIWAYERTPRRKGEAIPDNEDVVRTIMEIRDWHGAIASFKVGQNGNMISRPELVYINRGRIKPLDDAK